MLTIHNAAHFWAWVNFTWITSQK